MCMCGATQFHLMIYKSYNTAKFELVNSRGNHLQVLVLMTDELRSHIGGLLVCRHFEMTLIMLLSES